VARYCADKVGGSGRSAPDAKQVRLRRH